MKIYDTLTQKKKTFPSADRKNEKNIGMYVCGPTVYDVGHLGHARAAVSFDIIRRYLGYKGFAVTFVSNVTDVEDKMIKRAKEEGITEAELAERIIPEYEKDYGALRVLPPDHRPRATEYILEMVALIERLMEKDVAYATEDGVYFEVQKFKDYGKLSHQKLSELKAGARVTVDERKKNPEDFALWKKAKKGEPTWDGPRGMHGRPGWHIECSAMSMDLLGETFDIHGGGIDLVFPHHEDEIAQSEMATGKPFARFWLHNGHVKVNKEKMSKSLGNFFTIKDILKKYHPLVVRYFLLSTHYRMPIDFSDALLEQAKNSLDRLHNFMRRLSASTASDGPLVIKDRLAQAESLFNVAMDDDFEISKALAAIFDLINEMNALMDESKLSKKDFSEIQNVLQQFDTVLAVLNSHDSEVSVESDAAEIERLIQERAAARDARNFARADEIRDELQKRGILLEDTSAGTLWKKDFTGSHTPERGNL
ncbi:MAG: Cysteine-tRNA ligase [Candidatus Peregrinibacteria bacterium GW2011_GWA2_47_7]|nr:MAG: Cysteine-tRNA ligase [Candidatus Peregrinibacteria bacterium GW2011_GWA2_47_7]